MKYSIIIPCYNEEKNIPLIINGFKCIIGNFDIELVLVNNGSTDSSERVLKEKTAGLNFVKVVKVEKNQGYGFGILSGLKQATGEYIGWTHGDLQTPPSDVMKAFKMIEDKGSPKHIYIKGNRKGRSVFDNIFTVGMSIFESLYLGVGIYDINAQPNIFHRSFYEKWDNPPHDFSLDLYVYYLAKKFNLDIVRFDVVFPGRMHGESSWNRGLMSKWKFIKRTIEFSFKLKKSLEHVNEKIS